MPSAAHRSTRASSRRVGEVVEVLHGDDGRDGLRLGELGVRRLAEAEVTDQALLLEFGQGTERLGDGLPAGAFGPEPQVDGVEGVHAEVREVLLTWALRSAGSCEGRQLPSGAAARAHLGDDAQVRRVGVERLPDQLVDGDRAVEVAGVDVGDAAVDGFAQDRESLVAVPGRPEDPGPGQLHGAEAHAADDEVIGEPEGAAGTLLAMFRTPSPTLRL
jgi:hypothetical protein